ncbi:hypothetical protein EGR_02365 [Echinococcus granulosus]|uniref:Uncharacterized protein n=1 Tax=Echinococcus granulosus TaxID=6210 RepID=W6V8Q1_ECHGR|nr:hypothetical protein EGR_02365 [Echinococcus granulosus]EUB62924.1 hypothetical protein EGR_02365 [Echinococcus granulosus]
MSLRLHDNVSSSSGNLTLLCRMQIILVIKRSPMTKVISLKIKKLGNRTKVTASFTWLESVKSVDIFSVAVRKTKPWFEKASQSYFCNGEPIIQSFFAKIIPLCQDNQGYNSPNSPTLMQFMVSGNYMNSLNPTAKFIFYKQIDLNQLLLTSIKYQIFKCFLNKVFATEEKCQWGCRPHFATTSVIMEGQNDYQNEKCGMIVPKNRNLKEPFNSVFSINESIGAFLVQLSLCISLKRAFLQRIE